MIAGAAVRDLTPTQPVPLCGYPHVERISRGVHDPLLASALYLEDRGRAVVLVSLDLLMVNTGFARRLRARVAAAVGVPEAHVLISCTHTHSAPVTLRYLPFEMPPPDEIYLERCAGRIVEAARAAREAARPAKLGWTAADARGVGGNRHAPGGVTDPEVGVLAVRVDGTLAVVAMIYGMHPTVLHEDSTEVSGDFPAAARACIPAPVVLYHTGPAGDQSPRWFVRGQTFAEAERLGRTLGEAVAARLEAVPMGDVVDLGGRLTAVDLPRRPLPTPSTARRRLGAARRDLAALRIAGIEGPRVRTAEVAVFGAEALVRLAVAQVSGELEGVLAEILPAEVQVLTIGDTRVVGFPGEMFAVYGLELKRRSRFRAFAVCYANGELQGYLTPAGAQGYEASSGLFAPDSGEILVRTALEMME